MAKTNYTKVEEALAEGMRKIEVEKLLIIADENSAPKKGKKKVEQPVQAKVDPSRLHRLNWVKRELKALQKLGVNPYVKLKINKEEFAKFLKDPAVLSPQDWEKIQSIKEKITDLKLKRDQEIQGSDDDLINKQRKDQTTKRFNINEKWIPLR